MSITIPVDEFEGVQRDLVERSRAIAEEELKPYAARWDSQKEFPERSFQILSKAGFTSLTVPKAYGGAGLGVFEGCLVIEEVAAACLSSAMTIQMQVNGPPRVIARLGSEEQKRHYLTRIVDGTARFAIAMTEPQAGSDGTALETTLSPDGDGFRLDGNKCHITGAMYADAFLVFCRAPGTVGPEGIGAVLIDADIEGLAPIETEDKMGGRGVPEGVLKFSGAPVRPDQVILEPRAGSRDGAAFLVRQFNPERCGNAAMSVGIARAALEFAVEYLKEREQFGRPIIEFQGIQWRIAEMATRLDAARLLLWRAAKSEVDGFPDILQTAMAKLYANEAAVAICNEAIELLGHKGYLTRNPLERYYRDARGLGIGGGTTHIMRNMIGREVTGVKTGQRIKK